MKKFIITLIIVLSSLLITVFLIFINDTAVAIRMNELETCLQEMDYNESSIDHIGLIATYEIHKKIYEKRLSQESADEIEHRINLLIIKEKDYPAALKTKYRILSVPAILVINLNRKLLGKKPLYYHNEPDSAFLDLDIAFYYERNFLFNRAIALYDKALLHKDINNSLKASILLHQAYCYALSGLNEKAQNNYQIIINEYSQESSAITAAVLLRYLEGFKLARNKVLSSKIDPLSQSQDLVNLLAYEQALDILQETDLKAEPGEVPRIKYFMARCFTGLGKPEKAIETYLQVITDSSASQYAKYSNRKLYLIGLHAGGENKILMMSKQLNERLKDPVLTQMIQDQRNISDPADDSIELENLNIPDDLRKKADQFAKAGNEKTTDKKFVIMRTSDGNTFKGFIIEENEKEIGLQTSIGKINVKKDKIISVTAGK